MNVPDRGAATRLVLVRHAEPVPEARGRCYGSSDVGLSVAGQEHADALAVRLARFRAEAIISSPRRRALETATPAAAALDLDLSVDLELREMDFGEVEGQTYEEIELTRPELWQRWMSEPTAVRFPGGESYEDLRLRVASATAEIRRQHTAQTSIVVSHGGVIRAMLSAALGMPDANIFRLDQSFGAISVVDWFGDDPWVRIMNG